MISEIEKFNLIDRNSFLEYREPLVISEQTYRLIPKNKVSYVLSIPYLHIGIANAILLNRFRNIFQKE